MKTILVPTDFSKTAQYALDFAYLLAQLGNAKLLLLHSVEYPVGVVVGPIGVPAIPDTDTAAFDFMTKKAKQQMQDCISGFTDNAVKIDSIVEVGSPYLTIAEVVASHEVDMVVMGTHGATGLRETILGSNAEKVVRFAKCPVVTLKHDADPSQLKDIVFASDFNQLDDNVVLKLKQLQDLLGATIHFVRINTPNNYQRDRVILPFINGLIKKHMMENCTVSVYNDTYEEDGIINFAESINADMIALATHGRTGLSHLITGSLAEDVVNHEKRPVWTYHLGNK